MSPQFGRRAASYDAFSSLQQDTFDEVLSRLTGDPASILDVGCGTGANTCRLHERWPTASITGVDIEATMIHEASRRSTSIDWQVMDAHQLTHAPVDTVVSHATLQWCEATVFERLAAVCPTGQLVLSQFGPETFQELGDVVQQLFGLTIPAKRFRSATDIATIAQKLWGDRATVDVITLRHQVDTIMALCRSLSKTGTTEPSPFTWTRAHFCRLEDAYREQYGSLWWTAQLIVLTVHQC